LTAIEGVIKTYFEHGGEHIQINVVDKETLLDAQVNPEMHKGLMVRVAGYMAYFTELDKSAQDTIIYRTAHFSNAN
jgi:formate C-acetyltransferase